MSISKKSQKEKKHHRTSLEIEDEQTRTLYIRIPHTIKDVGEIKNLFFGTFRVKLPRQSSRYCHVIFSNLEEKLKNMKAIKKKLIDGKPIYTGPPKPVNLKKKKPKQKKIVMFEPVEEPNFGKYLYVSNIPNDVTNSEIKDAFPGCVTVILLKKQIKGKRQAKVKMSSSQSCLRYLINESEWPIIHGRKVSIELAHKKNNNKNKKIKQKSSPSKMHNKEPDSEKVSEKLEQCENKNKIDSDNVTKKVEDEEDVENEEDTESDEDAEDVEDTEDSNEEEDESTNGKD